MYMESDNRWFIKIRSQISKWSQQTDGVLILGICMDKLSFKYWQYFGTVKRKTFYHVSTKCKWAPASEYVSSSIPSWQILTAHAQPFRGARELAFCLKVPLDSLLVRASSGGSGEMTDQKLILKGLYKTFINTVKLWHFNIQNCAYPDFKIMS